MSNVRLEKVINYYSSLQESKTVEISEEAINHLIKFSVLVLYNLNLNLI